VESCAMHSAIILVFSALSAVNGINNSYSMVPWARYVDPKAAQVTSYQTVFLDSCNQRQAPGFVCMDCSVLARCVYRNNGWDTIPLEYCDAGQGLYCHANEQRCSANPGPCNPGAGQGGGNFICTDAGVFPDPFNCQMYHMCFPSGPNMISVNVLCGGNFAFNPITNDCSLDMTSPVCRGSQFTCNNVGDMGPWPLNPNIYYMCMASGNGGGTIRVLFPTLFRCPIGEVFRGGQCGLPNGIGGNLYNCQRAGLFPDPYDCHAYFHCDGLLRAQHIICPTGTYFNVITLGCIRGVC